MLLRLAYFLTGIMTAMLVFLVVDHGFPIMLALPVFATCVISCICCERK